MLAILLLWAAYQVREVLLLLYISGLLGDRLQSDHSPDRTAAAPADRHAAIPPLAGDSRPLRVHHRHLHRIGMMVFPPLIDQAQEFWAQKEQMFEQGAAVPA